jgi:hypothetical protein
MYELGRYGRMDVWMYVCKDEKKVTDIDLHERDTAQKKKEKFHCKATSMRKPFPPDHPHPRPAQPYKPERHSHSLIHAYASDLDL